MTHITFERLSELAELGAGPEGVRVARDEEARHLASCADCHSTVLRVRSLLAAAQSLPHDVPPPPEVWTQLRARVRRGDVRRASAWSWGRWIAAAASVVFIVGAALLIPRGGGKGDFPTAKGVPVPVSPAIAKVELHFAETLAELRATLDTQRTLFTPAAVNVVDETLAVIDTAIAETREALTDDPNNPALVEILASHYGRKVELLQRAAELAPSS